MRSIVSSQWVWGKATTATEFRISEPENAFKSRLASSKSQIMHKEIVFYGDFLSNVFRLRYRMSETSI